MSLISVIIPIYNVAPYLRECLDSIIHQTYPHLEIILVNDGSTDEGEEIAKEYLSDLRVHFVSQKNQGLSSARNTGMKHAKGDYIAFVDSDDYLSLSYFQEMLEVIEEFDADMVCNEAIVHFKESIPLLPPKKSPQKYIPDCKNIIFGGAVWRFLFAKKFLDERKILFLEGKIYEDEAFLYMLAPFCKSFVKYSGEPYFYRQRNNSIMAQHNQFRSYDLLEIFEAIYIFYKDHDLLHRFDPPYYFLYFCGIGYQNQREYLKRAKYLAKKLELQKTPRGLPLQMRRLLLLRTEVFLYWMKIVLKGAKYRNQLRRIKRWFKKSA